MSDTSPPTFPATSPGPSWNLLLNPGFDFHAFGNSRQAKVAGYQSGSVAGWNQQQYGDIQVYRAPRVAAFRPAFSVDNVVAIEPGKQFDQFLLLAEVGLDHGEAVSLSVMGYQPQAQQLQAAIHLMQLDSASGQWRPSDFGQADERTFPRHARGELVKGKTYRATTRAAGHFELKIENALIQGGFTEDRDAGTDQPNTVGLLVTLTNVSSERVWIYSPCLSRSDTALNRLPSARPMPTYYRGIPRTTQKLWRGEPLHIIVMGSSIDRGSANPPMYLYDENPDSPTFKHPLSQADRVFDGQQVGKPQWDAYIGWWQHYFMYGERLRGLLMEKFDYPIDKLLLNTMACDGSSISEAHSGLAAYASLSIPPGPEENGHKPGQTWEQLYPEIFQRPRGPGPDLVIFGGGANEKVDKQDEVALFEGAIRWFQRHYPDVEFIFCMWQNRENDTPNSAHLMELAMRYQIPYIDLGRTLNLVTRHCNSYALCPRDGHPQAAAHYIWAKQLERAFDVATPIEWGINQSHLPQRLHHQTIGWEGEIRTYKQGDPRIYQDTALILDDTVVNLWADSQDATVQVYVDGQLHQGSRRRPMTRRDLRNSSFATGALSLGDRHVIQVAGAGARLVAADAKVVLNRQFVGMDSPRWQLDGLEDEPFASQWGAPYGGRRMRLAQGQSVWIDVAGTDFSIAYVDQVQGGRLVARIDDQPVLEVSTREPFTLADGQAVWLENRKGIHGLPYGLHRVEVTAEDGPIDLLGLFTYDTRANRENERVERGLAGPGETVDFTTPFATRPIVLCNGELQIQQITRSSVTFQGSGVGAWQAVGQW